MSETEVKDFKDNFEEVDTIQNVELYACQGCSNDFVNKLKLQAYINISFSFAEKSLTELSSFEFFFISLF